MIPLFANWNDIHRREKQIPPQRRKERKEKALNHEDTKNTKKG
jgi:hypothetical protein